MPNTPRPQVWAWMLLAFVIVCGMVIAFIAASICVYGVVWEHTDRCKDFDLRGWIDGVISALVVMLTVTKKPGGDNEH